MQKQHAAERDLNMPIGRSGLLRWTAAGLVLLLSCGLLSACSRDGNPSASTSTSSARINSGQWGTSTRIGPGANLSGISCVSATFCLAVGGTSAFVFNGTTWTATPPSPDASALYSVSCVLDTFCMALGVTNSSVVTTVFNGSTWDPPTILDDGTVVNPEAVSCSSTSFCAAVGVGTGNQHDSVAYTYNGGTWSSASVLGYSIQLVSVSCPADGSCLAIGSGEAYQYQGGGWRNGVSTGLDFGSVACSSSRNCLAVGNATSGESGGGFNTFENGSWSTVQIIGLKEGPASVSCVTSSWCMGVGDQTEPSGSYVGDVYFYGGHGWNTPQLLSGSRALLGVSCPTKSFCAAIGEDSSQAADLVYQFHT